MSRIPGLQGRSCLGRRLHRRRPLRLWRAVANILEISFAIIDAQEYKAEVFALASIFILVSVVAVFPTQAWARSQIQYKKPIRYDTIQYKISASSIQHKTGESEKSTVLNSI